MPQDIARLPITFVRTTKTVRSLTLRSTRRTAGIAVSTAFSGILGSADCAGGLFLFFDELLALRAHEQKFARFFVEAGQIVIEDRSLDHAPGGFGAEIIF